MKKSLVFIAALLTCCMAKAQDEANSIPFSKLQIGIEAAPAMAGQSGIPAGGTPKPLFGFSAGFTGLYSFNESWAIWAGLGFDQKGNEITLLFTNNNGQNTGQSADIKDFFDYLDIPVLARYNFPGTLHFFANAGPYIGYLLSDIGYTTFNDNGQYPQPGPVNYTHYDKRFDAGACLGIGFNKSISDKILLELELRGNFAVTPVIPASPVGLGIHNQSLNLLIGARYKLAQ